MKATNLAKQAIENPEQAIRYLRRQKYDVYERAVDQLRNGVVTAQSRRPIGTNIFDREWQLLIILDCCRPDALRVVHDDYPQLDGKVDTICSLAGQSAEWMLQTFDRQYIDQIERTAYITANPHAATVFDNRLATSWDGSDDDKHINRLRRFGSWDIVDEADFHHFEEVWQYSDPETGYDYSAPEYVTDRGISVARNRAPERLILHYMPPHTPYIREVLSEGQALRNYDGSEMNYLQETGDKEAVYNAHLDMLRWVLDSVSAVLRNIDADTAVITADHGEAFGEHGVYYHHAGALHPNIRRVPWLETTATDTGTYEPNFKPESGRESDRDLEEALAALGYLGE